MAERRVVVKLSAEIQGFKRAMDEAAEASRKTKKATEETGKTADTSLGKLVEASQKNRKEWEQVGGVMLGVGVATVAGLGAATKAAIDWESAWAGVTKTVDGTPAQMDELEESLRGLATTLPATHEEIAGVAEAAGQLGVARDDVVGFTRTMIDLSETTNLSADEAATAIAQISNVMGTMARDGSVGVQRFGATLVALGNAGASTEKEIVMMAQRIAGAGKLVGATESDVLALANAMASVGIEAQLGGGVMSRVMQRMYGDVMEGGEGLQNLAKVAGVSSKDFAEAFESDPVRAVDAVIKGLNGVKDSGGNVIDTMKDLGIKGTEETSVILRLAGAGDLLSDSLDLGAKAWKDNSALAEEAAKRYETTEAKIQIAWNTIKDAAIDAGAVILPVVSGIAESVAGLAGWFGDLPEPVQGALTVLTGVVGVGALAAGAFLTLFPRVVDTVGAFRNLARDAPGAATGLQKVSKAAGAAGAIAVLGLTLAKIAEASYMDDIDTGMGRVAKSLAEVATNSPSADVALDTLFKDRNGEDLIRTVDDLDSAIKRTFNKDTSQKFNDWGESMVNAISPVSVQGSSQILTDAWERMDQGLADLVSSGNADGAEDAFDKIKQAAESQGVSVEQLAAIFPEYGDALAAVSAEATITAAETANASGAISDMKDASGSAVPMTEEVAEALEEVGLAADGTVQDLSKFTDALMAAGLLNLSARDAARGFEAAIDDMGVAVAKNGVTLDRTTEQGRANEAALDAIAAAGFKVVEANARNGESQETLQQNLSGTYDSLIAAAGQLGITGDEADTLARKVLDIPDDANVNTWLEDTATRLKIQTLTQDINNIPTSRTFTFNFAANPLPPEAQTFRSMVNSAIAPGNAGGGRIPANAAGGRLPLTGPGTGMTDGILGVSSLTGQPTSWVDAGEWVINRNSSAKYDRELAAINAGTFPQYPGYAGGGHVGREYMPAQNAVAGIAPAINLTAIVENPWTGEQVEARVVSIASGVADAAIGSANTNEGYRRKGVSA